MTTGIYGALLNKQHELNVSTSGENYLTGVTNKGKTIDWNLCIIMELCELIDSYPWKHWKSISDTPDFDNIKIELVDVLHFILSLDLEEVYNKTQSVLDHSLVVHSIEFLQNPVIKKSCRYDIDKILSDNPFIAPVDHLLDIVKHWVKSETMTAMAHYRYLSGIMQYLEEHELFTEEEMFKLYFGKNALNYFRQQHGYKEGTYIKNWGEEYSEDNEYMLHIINDIILDDSFSTTLLIKLEEYYKTNVDCIPKE